MKSVYHKLDTTLSDMIKACQNVGTETHKTSLFAAALKTPDKLCYNCKKPGHLQKDCRVKRRLRNIPIKNALYVKKAFIGTIYISKTDISGNPISGPPPPPTQSKRRGNLFLQPP